MRLELANTLCPGVSFACLAMLVTGFGKPTFGQGAEPLAAIEILAPSGSAEKSAAESVQAFAGRTLPLRWLVRAPVQRSLRLELDVFLVSSVTVVPLEKGIVLAEKVQASDGNPCEIGYRFSIPDSERPLRYLLRLRVLSGDAQEVETVHGQPLFVDAVTDDVLLPMAGRKISLVGFGDSAKDAEWTDVLTEAGVVLEYGTASVSGNDRSRRGAASDHLVMVRCPDGARLPNEFLKSMPGTRILFLYDSAVNPVAIVTGGAEESARMKMGIDRLQNLGDSPDKQKWLVEFFTDDLSAAAFLSGNG